MDGARDLSRMRNIGIVAHIDAGKTTVTERILFYTGVEHRIGQVDEGTAVMDWMAEERERGITITAAATTVPWRDYEVTIVDTPGHVDFTVEVERCMRVLDGAVLVLDAVMGVQAQSETVWRQMRRHRVPCIAFANKCDRPGADPLAVSTSMRERLGAPAVPLHYPVGIAGEFHGAIDLLTRETWDFSGDLVNLRAEARPIPDEIADEVGVLRAELVEMLADGDDDICAAVLEDREPEVGALKAALRKRVIEGTLVPVLCGAALREMGIHPILDAVIDYLPSPAELPPVRGVSPKTGEEISRGPTTDEPFTALSFKLHSDAHGDLTFVRIYSGTLTPKTQLYNPRVDRTERAARILRMHAESGKAVEVAGPGEIVALTGLKWTGTGDTLCTKADPILLEGLEFPEPVITMIAEPSSGADRDKLRQALARLAHEDPSLRVREDEDTGQWSIAGMGELHLEVVRHRLRDEFKVEPRMGKPHVAYREAVQVAGKGSGHVDRVLGGKEIFGAVDLEVLPAPDAIVVTVEWADGDAIPRAFRRAVQEAIENEAQVGPRFGYPLVGARVRITGGASHERNDSELGFAQAAVQALRHALQDATIALLEPVMAFEIQTPAEFASGILADLNARRAEMTDVRASDVARTACGTVPLSQMFGYATTVRSLSQGRASFSMQPAGYRPVPEDELAERGLVWT